MKHNYTRLNHILILASLVWILIAACKNNPSDTQIQQTVSEKLSPNGENNSYQGFAKVQAATNEGVVTLTGECEGSNCADSAASLVRNIDGVKDVVNNVKEIAAETDLTLRTSIQAVISKYEGVQADVAGGVVVLRGQIQREQLQPLMNELSVLNPKKIDNQLAVK